MDRKEKTQGDSAGSQNGIFSTPDLTVNVENLAQDDSDTTKSRVASFFANTDATQQAQKLNNAVMVPEETLPAPNSRNVNSRARGRSKLPIIITSLAVLAVAGVTIFAIVNNRNEDGKSSQVSATQDEAKQDFHQYASYLLFGNQNSDLSDGYSSIQTYKFSEEFYSETKDAAYWDEATNLLDKSVNAYASVETKDEYLENLLQGHRSLFVFLKDYHMQGDPTKAQLIASYSSGVESARSFVENFYRPLTENDLYDVQSLAQQKIAYYNLYIDFIEVNDAAGCVVNGEIIQPCNSESGFDMQRYIDLLGEMNAADNLAAGMLLDMVDGLEKQCWDVWDEFNSPSGSSSETESAL